MNGERVWIPLEQSRVTDNESVFAEPLKAENGQYSMKSCPVFAAIGFGDIVSARRIQDFDAWLAGQEEQPDPDDSLPFVTSLSARSNRITLVFSVLGSTNSKIIDEICAGLGQQCLNAEADGEGVGDATGLVCVPEEFSQTHSDAWRWLFEQMTLVTPKLSRGAQSALEKNKAWLSAYFANVPEMSTEVVPGLRRHNADYEDQQHGGSYEDPSSASATAEALKEAGREQDALRVLEHSAYGGNPASLVNFMMRTISLARPGWALAADYWFDVGGYWDDCPADLNPYIWEDDVDEWRVNAAILQSAARLYASDPRHESEALLLVGAMALRCGQHKAAKDALRRAASSGLTAAMVSALWIDILVGDPSQSLAVFESVHYPKAPDPELPPISSNPMFKDLAKDFLEPLRKRNEIEELNVISNAGLAYALSGNAGRAEELWQAAQEFAEARWWSSVLLAHQGNMEAAVERAQSLIRPEDWDSLESALTIAEEIPEDELQSEYIAWIEASQELHAELEA